MAFTKEQELAINTHGTNLMVSAGAGSGKTAVLTERIYKMLESGYDISRLLVLTFTNAAALEMKTRIKKRVLKSGILKEQLEKIDSAFITTFDAFALSLVKKYHYLLDISKDVTIVEEVVMYLKKKEIIDDIFLQMYQSNNPKFFDILRKFTFKDDSDFRDSILKIAGKLEKKPNKEKYLRTYIENTYNDFVVNGIVQTYEKECNERLQDISFYAKELYDSAIGSPLADSLNELMAYAGIYHDYDELVSFFNFQFKLKNGNKGDEEIKPLRKEFKEKILDKYIDEFLRFESVEFIKKTLWETQDYVEVIIEILNEYFDRISKYKHEVNLFEFDDISMMLLELFDKHEEVLKEVSLSFDEILLDEYQDTSDIQEEFIQKISRNNVYMVGDIKQSIYRFRNANPYIFKDKYDSYDRYENDMLLGENGVKIDLNKNFRSRKEVLSNINLLFKHLMTQDCGDANYIEEHQMNYGNTDYDIHKMDDFSYDQEYLVYDHDETKYFSNDEIEVFIIASKIKELMSGNVTVYDKDLKKSRPIEFKDIAIIIPRKKQVSLIERIFTKEGIPLSVQVDDKITDSIIIKLMNSLFNLVLNVDTPNVDDYKFYFLSVARSFLFEMNDNEILQSSFSDFKDNEIYTKAKLVKKYMHEHSVTKTFEYLLEEFNVYQKLIKLGDINTHLYVINYVANLINNLKDYGYDFKDVAKHFEVIIDQDIEINYSKSTNPNGVVLINIHKSKGLEYPICFFADLVGGFNRVDVKESFLFDKDFGFITPYFLDTKEDTVLKTLYKNKYIKEDISERIRLFYVALTRAREKMYFVIPKIDYLKVVPSPFSFSSYSHFISFYYNEAVAKFVKEINYDEIVNKDYLEFSSSDYKDGITKVTPLSYSNVQYIGDELHKVKISKSIDELITPDTAYVLKLGTRLHEILQTLDLVTKDYSKLNLTNREKELLDNVLSLECFADLSNAKVYKEYQFLYYNNNREYNGIIDLLIEYDDHFEIIDYKLSDIDKEEYIKQLNEYYNYLRLITNKDIKMYLLSITNAKLKEVFVLQ